MSLWPQLRVCHHLLTFSFFYLLNSMVSNSLSIYSFVLSVSIFYHCIITINSANHEFHVLSKDVQTGYTANRYE